MWGGPPTKSLSRGPKSSALAESTPWLVRFQPVGRPARPSRPLCGLSTPRAVNVPASTATRLADRLLLVSFVTLHAVLTFKSEHRTATTRPIRRLRPGPVCAPVSVWLPPKHSRCAPRGRAHLCIHAPAPPTERGAGWHSVFAGPEAALSLRLASWRPRRAEGGAPVPGTSVRPEGEDPRPSPRTRCRAERIPSCLPLALRPSADWPRPTHPEEDHPLRHAVRWLRRQPHPQRPADSRRSHI